MFYDPFKDRLDGGLVAVLEGGAHCAAVAEGGEEGEDLWRSVWNIRL